MAILSTRKGARSTRKLEITSQTQLRVQLLHTGRYGSKDRDESDP